MTLINKYHARRECDRLGAGYLSNVIENNHKNPARKLKGLVNLLKAGHDVRISEHSIDIVLIDNHKASWIVLEEWAKRTF